MVSSRFIPWDARSARPFPAQRWLEERYPFRVPPTVFVQPKAYPPAAPAPSGRRRFPAQVWLADPQAWLADLQQRMRE